MESRGKLEVVLVAFPAQGHLTPMLQLGAILHSRGFSILVAHSHLNAPDPSNHPDFTFLPLSDNKMNPYSNNSDVVAFIEQVNDNCKPHFHDLLVDTINERRAHHHHQIACIVHDPAMYFVEDVAQILKIPSIIMPTGNALSMLVYAALPRLHAQATNTTTLDDLVPELEPLRFKDLPAYPNGNVALDLALLINATAFRRPAAVIWNTIGHLEHSALELIQQQHLKPKVPFFTIGPFHKVVGHKLSTSLLTEDGSCISWLNQQVPKSVVYVSLGSLAVIDEKELVEMAWGLANSNQPFLWVVRPGSVHDSEWIELLPEEFKETVGERGCIVKWAPQKEVLAHEAVGGFWSHCGWNSTMESICEGVPMMPSFSDQTVNARYLSHVWGVGLEMEHELERGKVERGIKRLMVEEEGSRIRQRATELKEKVEVSMMKGGSSYNSLNDLEQYILSFEHLVGCQT